MVVRVLCCGLAILIGCCFRPADASAQGTGAMRGVSGQQSVDQRWKLGPEGGTLPGFVPLPAVIPGVKSWQLTTKAVHSAVNALAWSPDDKRIAVGCEDGTIRVYSAAGLAFETLLIGHQRPVTELAWDPTGATLASGGRRDKTVRLWNVRAGIRPTREIACEWSVSHLAWSPRGDQLAFGDIDGGDGIVRLWDGDRVRPLEWSRGDVYAVSGIAWTADQTQLAVVHDGSSFKIGSVAGQKLAEFSSKPPQIEGITWMADESVVATGHGDGSIRRWDARTGKLLATRAGRRSLSEDGVDRLIGTGEENGIIRRPDARTARLRAIMRAEDRLLWDDLGEDWLLATRLWNSALGSRWLKSVQRTRPAKELESVSSIAWAENGQKCVTADYRGTLCLRTREGTELANLPSLMSVVDLVGWSPDGRSLAATNHALWIWHADGRPNHDCFGKSLEATGETSLDPAADLEIFGFPVSAERTEAWSIRGRFAKLRKYQWIWPEGKLPQVREIGTSIKYWGRFSPDRKQYLSESPIPPACHLIDYKTKKVVQRLLGFRSPSDCVAWAPDGKQIALCAEFTITVWDLSTGQPLYTIVAADRSSFVTLSGAGQPLDMASFLKQSDKFIAIVEQDDGTLTLSPVTELLQRATP